MGHRAIVAYERDNGNYDARYSHWGANELKLARLIRPTDQLGDGYVDEEPTAEDVALQTIVDETLDYLHHEAFYVVNSDWEVAPIRTLCTALFDVYGHGEPETNTMTHGLLGAGRWYSGEPVHDSYLRGMFNGVKDVTADLVEDGYLEYEESEQFMLEKMQGDMITNRCVVDPADQYGLDPVLEYAFEQYRQQIKPAITEEASA